MTATYDLKALAASKYGSSVSKALESWSLLVQSVVQGLSLQSADPGLRCAHIFTPFLMIISNPKSLMKSCADSKKTQE